MDDQPTNLRLLEAVLSPQGYQVITASSGEQALELLHSSNIDLVLLDIMMPGIDGYEVCRRIRSEPSTAFLPVVMITASGDYEKTRAIKAGADDFVSKPFHQGELLARVASLARLKRYHDTITRQAAELAQWNAELEARVRTQLEDLQRVNRLRRFLSPQVAELVINSGDDSFLRSHRREIVVVF
ncbi:MAG TPA: response regulator, partial [Propionibacteriaceae bacterium]|nr:response regulator [Propionibacteriaceae bacterium]